MKRPDAQASRRRAPSLREAARRDKAERIREAGLALLREKGFEGTTTREVAERAGIAAGTLFLYVRTKEELLQFLFRDEILCLWRQRADTLPESAPLEEQLLHLFGGFLGFYARDRDVARILLREALLPAPGSANLQLTLDFLGELARRVEAAQGRGELEREVPAALLAQHLFTLYLGAVLALVTGGLELEAATAWLRTALELHLDGARAPKKRRKR